MLRAIAPSTSTWRGSSSCWKGKTVARKGYRKRTPEEKAAWRERRRRRFEELLQRRLERAGVTREEALRRLRPDV
jgi:hypothetical protein